MIKKQTIQEIFETAKVEEVVGDFVLLKRRGVNLIGLCPFHNEKTPSFIVSPNKNIYKCFGCGRGGNSVNFLMEHESLTYPESLKTLAKRYNIEIEETVRTPEMIAQEKKRDSLFIINQYAKDFFLDQLFNTDQGKSIGLSYFKDRGFREEIIQKFGLGFAPGDNDKFTKKASREGFRTEWMKELGLTSQYDKDFFRSRVMFPIHNLSGKVIGFGGRILVSNKKAPKYINSPESEIYFKSKVLYGYYFAKREIRKQDECILVEGYTDVISLHQSNIENVVASSGTSLTIGQIQLIKRNTPNIKILYDGDSAGIKAALRGLDLVLEQDMNVSVVILPDGEDPDSYLQKVGTTKFKEYIDKEAKELVLFETSLLLDEAKGDPSSISKVIKKVVATIAKILDPIKRDQYIKQCSELLNVDESALFYEFNKQRRHDIQNKKRKRSPEPDANTDKLIEKIESEKPPSIGAVTLNNEYQEKHIAKILIESGGELFDEEEKLTVAAYFISNLEDVLDSFDNKQYEKIIKECHQRLIDKKPISPQHFFNHSDKEIRELSISLTSSPYEFSEGWNKLEIGLQTQLHPDKNFNKDSIQVMLILKRRLLDKVLGENQERIRQAQDNKDADQLDLYIKMQMKLLAMRNEIAKELKTVVVK